jgi:hypothetical protein
MEHHMAIEKDLLDQLLAGRDPKDVFNKDGLVDELKKALSERILNTELDEHLDSDGAEGKSNHRNGYSKKSVLTGTSKKTLSVPRDRAGTFDPKLIAKYQRRFPDFDDKIISMYARGMSVREIRGHLEELYGIDVSPDLISAITDAVLEEVAEWQSRPLDIPADGRSNLHRSPDPPFDGLCILEGSQGRRAGAAHCLSRRRCRHRPGCPRGFCARSVGQQVSGHRAKLAPQLGTRHSVLRFPRRRAADHLHHQCNRGAELKAASRRQDQGTFSL